MNQSRNFGTKNIKNKGDNSSSIAPNAKLNPKQTELFNKLCKVMECRTLKERQLLMNTILTTPKGETTLQFVERFNSLKRI